MVIVGNANDAKNQVCYFDVELDCLIGYDDDE